MFFKDLCVLVLCMKIASALEGLIVSICDTSFTPWSWTVYCFINAFREVDTREMQYYRTIAFDPLRNGHILVLPSMTNMPSV